MDICDGVQGPNGLTLLRIVCIVYGKGTVDGVGARMDFLLFLLLGVASERSLMSIQALTGEALHGDAVMQLLQLPRNVTFLNAFAR